MSIDFLEKIMRIYEGGDMEKGHKVMSQKNESKKSKNWYNLLASMPSHLTFGDNLGQIISK